MSKLFNILDADKKMLTNLLAVLRRSLALAGRLTSGSGYDVDHAGIGTVLSEQEKRAEAMQRHMTPYSITQNVEPSPWDWPLQWNMRMRFIMVIMIQARSFRLKPLNGSALRGGDSIYWHRPMHRSRRWNRLCGIGSILGQFCS
ncbi:MAG: hypothetical protein ACLSA6_08325 [Holdemania massiliensis]